MERGWIFLFGLLLVGLTNNSYVEGLGVNWGTVASHPLPPKDVVQLLKDIGIQKVKLFDSNENILNALAGSDIEVMIAIPNLELQTMMDKDKAKAWVQHNVTRYNVTSKDGVKITLVGIGNEPFLRDYKDMFVNSTLPALTNIQNALNDAGIGNVTRATIPFNADVYYSPSYDPVPSTGIFRPDIVDTVKKILEVMDKNNAPFIVNIYPFLSAYQGNGQFPIEFAFFEGKANPVNDEHTGSKYTNVFDAMVDTLAAALKREGYGNMSIVVGEMGWPTDGDVLANVSMAQRFYSGLVKHLASNKGTPLRPQYPEVYMFALFDEDGKSTLPGNFERSWGIYRYDGVPKFPLDLSGGAGPSKNLVAAKNVQYQPKKWCQVKSDVKNKTALEESVKYACSNGADCTPLGNGSSCNGLSDAAKASYAFNAFFQVNNQAPQACSFGGSGTITTTNISEPTCNFTIQIVSSVSANAPAPSPSASSSHSGSSSGNSHEDKSSSSAHATYPSAWSFSMVVAVISTLLAQLV